MTHLLAEQEYRELSPIEKSVKLVTEQKESIRKCINL